MSNLRREDRCRRQNFIRVLLAYSMLLCTLKLDARADDPQGVDARQVVIDRDEMKKISDLVKPDAKWGPAELNAFLKGLPDRAMFQLLKGIGKPCWQDRETDVLTFQNYFLWESNNVLLYYTTTSEKIDYHGTVVWVAEQIGVDPWVIKTQPTFIVERAIFRHIVTNTFPKAWEKMSREKRLEFIKKIDTKHKLNGTEIASMSGVAALATLNASVYFAGFAFYTTMSMTIAAIGGLAGVTVPFFVYVGASTTVGVLTGPIGWTCLAVVASVGAVSYLGKASNQKTLGMIYQLHMLKVQALEAAGKTCPIVPEPPTQQK